MLRYGTKNDDYVQGNLNGNPSAAFQSALQLLKPRLSTHALIDAQAVVLLMLRIGRSSTGNEIPGRARPDRIIQEEAGRKRE
jgi:hypothetical protein